jgi:hypothetical protein
MGRAHARPTGAARTRDRASWSERADREPMRARMRHAEDGHDPIRNVRV